MEIKLINLGKRYNREWIFRKLDYTFIGGNSYAITGSNGSGKSTLLQVIAGSTMHNEGTIEYINPSIEKNISAELFYKNIAVVAPYLELIEEMTAAELIKFHRTFKELKSTDHEILTAIGLSESSNKQIRYFSSGMKQRLKLGLAFFCNTEVIMLDEPCTNLDASGIQLYHRLIQAELGRKTIIVCSNDRTEYDFCEKIIEIEKYK